jgi:hypothetical protein
MRCRTDIGSILIAGLVLLVCDPLLIAAGPGSRDTEAVLPVGPWELSHDAYEGAVAKYREADDRAKAVLFGQSGTEAKQKGEKKSSPLLAIGEAYTSVIQARRLANVLFRFREPAALDLQLRLDDLEARLMTLRKVLLDNGKTAEQVAKSAPKWLQDAEAIRVKNTPKVEHLIEQGRWEEVTKLLYLLGDDLRPRGFWYEGNISERGMKPIVGALHRVEAQYLDIVQRQADEAFGKLLSDTLATLESEVAEIESALKAGIEQSKAVLDGHELAGPELLTALAARCRQTELKAHGALALCWRWADRKDNLPAELPTVAKAMARLSATIVDGSRRLIDADAGRTDASSAPALYQRYLLALVPLVADDATESLVSTTRESLEKLAAKSPEFGAEVAAYRRVTSNVLRWRERAARATAATKDTAYSTVVGRLRDPASKTPVDCRFDLPVDQVVRSMVSRLEGAKVSAGDLSANGPTALGRFEKRSYARVTPVPDLRGLAAELGAALWASGAAPALTLDAAAAIETAANGTCELAGGTVESFELEALATRFATLSDDDWGIVHLEPRFNDSSPRVFLDDWLLSVAVQPDWYQHRYGFVEVK